MEKIRIATRKSPLALWQAEFVKHALQQAHPGLEVELLGMTTKGDKILDAPLAKAAGGAKVGGKGLFVKELEQALLEKRADIAVHSMKDVPMDFPPGLGLVVICQREDPRDAFVSNHFAHFAELPQGARVGTSSLRRQCQLKALRSDLQIMDLRGNVNTRLSKLDDGEFDGIILATAGLLRLGLESRISERLAVEKCLPAGGQGAVGIECRVEDKAIEDLLKVLHHAETAQLVAAERAVNGRLQGGCQVPIACYAVQQGEALFLRGLVGQVDGNKILRSEIHGALADAASLGNAVAEDLLRQGADLILQAVREMNP